MNKKNDDEAEKYIRKVFDEVKRFYDFTLSRKRTQEVIDSIGEATQCLIDIVKAAELAPVGMKVACPSPQIMSRGGYIIFNGEDSDKSKEKPDKA